MNTALYSRKCLAAPFFGWSQHPLQGIASLLMRAITGAASDAVVYISLRFTNSIQYYMGYVLLLSAANF